MPVLLFTSQDMGKVLLSLDINCYFGLQIAKLYNFKTQSDDLFTSKWISPMKLQQCLDVVEFAETTQYCLYSEAPSEAQFEP